MTRRLLVDRQGPLLRAAVLTGGDLTDLHLDRDDRPSRLGAVLLGRVTRLVPGLDAAFVEIGDSTQSLLNAADVRPLSRKGREGGIGRLLRAGQEVVVQVKADAHGGKGAVVTMDVSLPGRFLVHLPAGDGIHVSKRLGAGPERASLTRLVREAALPGGGWIVRAGSANADPGLIALEAEALQEDWRRALAAREGAAAHAPAPAPALLLAPPDAVARAVLEAAGPDLTEIRVEGGELLTRVRAWLRRRAADLEPLVKPHVDRVALFEMGDLDGAIRALGDIRVPLPQGGSLVIERTEALTVIDVNGGERGNALATNLDAVREIARQLRLRNIGGIFVIDFITLSRAADREHLVLAMSHAVADDPAGTHVYGISRLGLMELTRSRRGPPVADLLADLP
ncbi:MAG: hypothetical protein RLY86_2412 [Pseudomonadota bacterium]|jgi:ribonuclease E/ribonuclease G